MNTKRILTLTLVCLLAIPAFVSAQDQTYTNRVVVSPPNQGGGWQGGGWQGNFSADIWTNRNNYTIGDSVDVNFRTSRDAYVYIFNTDALGQRTQIFPNWYDQDNFVRGGVTNSIPARNYDLRITGPAGRESLEMYAVTDDDPYIDVFHRFDQNQPFAPLSNRGERALERIQVVPQQQTQAVVVVPVPTQPQSATAITTFEVRNGGWGNINQCGRLTIRCEPSQVAVYIDGNFIGYGPGTFTGIPAGDHEIMLYRPGYRQFTEWVTIRPNATTNLRVDLRQTPRHPYRSDNGQINPGGGFYSTSGLGQGNWNVSFNLDLDGVINRRSHSDRH